MTETTKTKAPARQWARPAVAISIAAGVLLLGYGDLVRGGLTFSAALLTLGYCIFVPVAIMTVPTLVQRPVHRANKLRQVGRSTSFHPPHGSVQPRVFQR